MILWYITIKYNFKKPCGIILFSSQLLSNFRHECLLDFIGHSCETFEVRKFGFARTCNSWIEYFWISRFPYSFSIQISGQERFHKFPLMFWYAFLSSCLWGKKTNLPPFCLRLLSCQLSVTAGDDMNRKPQTPFLDPFL